jgi:hypothetical protein
MTELNQSQTPASSDLVDKIRFQAKHIADVGQNLLKHLSKGSVSRMDDPAQMTQGAQVIDVKAEPKQLSASDTRQNPHELFRQQLPSLTQQLLGKRFHSLNRIASFVAPEGSFDKASDQILEILADFASSIGDSYQVLDEAGVGTLAELQHDTARSGRLARALGEQNRLVGIAQGALSGALGVVGAAADLPLSMIIALRTIYLTGRAYGFDLDQPDDRALVFEALSKVDLTLVAEKQAIFLGLRTLGNMLNTGDWQHLQTLLGSNNNIEPLRKFLSDETGQLKWKLSPALISKIAPLVGGAAGAIYNARFIQEVSEQAQIVFAEARQQLILDKTNDVDRQVDARLAQQPPKDTEISAVAAQAHLLESETIEKVALKSRDEVAAPLSDEAQDEQIHQQLETLAETLIEPVVPAASEAAKPKAPRSRKKAAPVEQALNNAAETASDVENTVQAVTKAPRRRTARPKAATPSSSDDATTTKPAAALKRTPAKKVTPPKDDSAAE